MWMLLIFEDSFLTKLKPLTPLEKNNENISVNVFGLDEEDNIIDHN